MELKMQRRVQFTITSPPNIVKLLDILDIYFLSDKIINKYPSSLREIDFFPIESRPFWTLNGCSITL